MRDIHWNEAHNELLMETINRAINICQVASSYLCLTTMASTQYTGELLRGASSSSFLCRILSPYDLPVTIASERILHVLSAFRHGQFSFIERAACLSVCVGLPIEDAACVLSVCDMVLDIPEQLSNSYSDLIIEWYVMSDNLNKSIPCRVGCSRTVCCFCGGYLQIRDNQSNVPLGPEELLKDSSKTPRYYTNSGAFSCIETVKSCCACGAIHHCSQAWSKDQAVCYHYPLSQVDVIRVTNLTFINVDVVIRAIHLLADAHVSPHTAADLLRAGKERSVGSPPITVCSRKILRHSMLHYLCVWWNQVVEALPWDETNAESFLRSETALDEYLNEETLLILDDSEGKRIGRLHLAQMTWALQHQCVDHPDCKTGLIMDGNFDTVAKLIMSSRKPKPLKAVSAMGDEDSESDAEDGGEEFAGVYPPFDAASDDEDEQGMDETGKKWEAQKVLKDPIAILDGHLLYAGV